MSAGEDGARKVPAWSDDEEALDAVDDWGPAEDWSDWVAWADARDRAPA
jgi:hypothetical protein